MSPNNSPELGFHEEQDVTATSDKEELHKEVVQGYPTIKQVEIASNEDSNVECLGLERDTCGRYERETLNKQRAA